MSILISVPQAQALLAAYGSGDAPVLELITHSSTCTEYRVRIAAETIYSLKLGPHDALNAESSVITSLMSKAIPVTSILKLDNTQTIVPSAYLLLSHPAASSRRLSVANITSQDRALSYLCFGSYLRQIHDIENDWFGLPNDPGEWSECYSWQECFTLLVETALDATQMASEGVPALLDDATVTEIRTRLSRAIGYFLFDDVEVPSLVWNADLDWDQNVFLNGDSDGEIRITCLSGWCSTGTFWGDPLMEGALREPSDGVREGYGRSPILFPRQRTKRLWYTLYAAVRSLTRMGERFETTQEKDKEVKQAEWDDKRVRDLLAQTMLALKDAPCY